jgi:hypothetical protein
MQRVSFKTLKDPVLSYLHIVLDRKTGGGAISAALSGVKATLTIPAEMKNYIADSDDPVAKPPRGVLSAPIPHPRAWRDGRRISPGRR